MIRPLQLAELDPWELIWGQPYIDVEKLSVALETELADDRLLDFRSRLLIKDAVTALQSYWGQKKFEKWLQKSAIKVKVIAILEEKLGKPGYRSIRRRLVTNIKKDQLEQVFEILGKKLQRPLEVYIAGSIPTLIEGLTARPTDDIDFVDEVPPAIREQRAVIKQVEDKYGLTLGHVQSHYLPENWKERGEWFGDFGKLKVRLVDAYDIFVSKLCSKKEKHVDDIRVLAAKLDMETARERLLTDGKAFLESSFDRPTIEANWKFIYRQPLDAPQLTSKPPKKPKQKPDSSRKKKPKI